jgi:hypothetical protein
MKQGIDKKKLGELYITMFFLQWVKHENIGKRYRRHLNRNITKRIFITRK